MTRIRRRRTRETSEDRAWTDRREVVLHDHPDLARADEFWKREPGVPAALRHPAHRRDVLATRPEDAARLRAEYEAQLEARRRWLDRHGL